MREIPLRYSEPAAELRQRGIIAALRMFGPGAIVASVTIGSGETIFASRGGAIFGYTLFWCFIISAVLKACLVYSGSRFQTLTGLHPLQSWMHLPGPRGWFVVFVASMTVFWMPFFLGGGLPRMLGEFANWVVGFPSPSDSASYVFYGRLWGTGFVAVAIVCTWLQSYGVLERVQTAIVALLLVCVLVAAAVSGPDLGAMFTGSFVPRIPSYEPWLLEKYPAFSGRNAWVEMVVYLGVIGGGTQDYIGYLGLLREKAWGLMGRNPPPAINQPMAIEQSADNVARAKLWLRPALTDVTMSFGSIVLFTLGFAVLGATMLYPRRIIPDGFDLLSVQSGYLTVTGQPVWVTVLLSILYKTGIFFAFFGTIYGAYELYTRTSRECFVALFPRLATVPLREFRRWTLVWCGGVGLALLWFLDQDPVAIITPAALVGEGLICGLWCLAMLWSDRTFLPAALRMGALLRIGVLTAGVVLTVIPIVGIAKYLSDLRN